MKKTLVLGATTNMQRYAYMAAIELLEHGHQVVLIGKDKGEIEGQVIQNEWYTGHDIDTVTLYLNPSNQKEYYKRLLDLKPKRVIFNPGTVNPELTSLLEKQGIECENACTLVMLSTKQY